MENVYQICPCVLSAKRKLHYKFIFQRLKINQYGENVVFMS